MELTLKNAKQILEVVLKFASETKPGPPITAAVVDGAGVLICLARMDGASPLTVRMAINKAYTAIDWGRDTKEIRELFFTGETKRDIAWYGEPRHAPIPGGILLKAKDGTISGAVGTTGHRTPEEDEELAQVVAKAYQETLTRKSD